MSGRVSRPSRLDLPVWAAFLLLFILGWAVGRSVDARVVEFADPQASLRIQYPAGWFSVPNTRALFEVQNPRAGTAHPTRLVVTREPRATDRTLQQIATDSILSRSRHLPMYRELSLSSLRVGGKAALAIEYAFVADPHESLLATRNLPIVVLGRDVVLLTDSVVYHLDFQAAAETFDRERLVFDHILEQARL